MTKDERNAAIVAGYKAGRKLAELAREHRLGRGRVLQILKAADAWVPYIKGPRTQFLGISVSEETKEALAKLAREKGTSTSRLASDALDRVVEEAVK